MGGESHGLTLKEVAQRRAFQKRLSAVVDVGRESLEFTKPSRRHVSAHKKDGGSLAEESVGVLGYPGARDSTHFIYLNR